MRAIFTGRQIKLVDQVAADYLKLTSYELMQKAGAAIFSYVKHMTNLLVVAGAGNNAGDGYIIADLAQKNGIKVVVWNIIPVDNLPKDAQIAAKRYLTNGGELISQPSVGSFDCIVDAIFGTGLSRNVSGLFADAVLWINTQNIQTLSVDIPSGLDADTGSVRACAVRADNTVSVICYKVGLVTNNGKDFCGTLFLEDLDVKNKILNQIPPSAKLLDKSILSANLFQRKQNTHKGSFGQVLIAGGHDGMLGALILTGSSALHSGCGLVEVVSNSQQVVMASIHCPELMTAGTIKSSRLIDTANVIAIGPGLGLNQQSQQVLQYCLKQNKPMVIDADALTLIAGKHKFTHDTILTPHPKEAATLLATDVKSIQSNRVKSAQEISNKYNAVVVLKGSGTVITQPNGAAYICPYGNAGMATAGMGDVLTGIIASLLAQGFCSIDAANTAVVWHAIAADNCYKGNCLVASDVISQLYKETSWK